MESLQRQVQLDPLDENLHRAPASAVKEYSDLSRAPESFDRQKSRVQWLNLGDKNSQFCFRAMKSHHNKSKIMSISREDGMRVEELKIHFPILPQGEN